MTKRKQIFIYTKKHPNKTAQEISHNLKIKLATVRFELKKSNLPYKKLRSKVPPESVSAIVKHAKKNPNQTVREMSDALDIETVVIHRILRMNKLKYRRVHFCVPPKVKVRIVKMATKNPNLTIREISESTGISRFIVRRTLEIEGVECGLAVKSPELNIQSPVIEYANGIPRTYAYPIAKGNGHPDSVVVRHPTELFIEFKSAGAHKSSLGKHQERYIKQMRKEGKLAYVVNDVDIGKKLVDDVFINNNPPTEWDLRIGRGKTFRPGHAPASA